MLSQTNHYYDELGNMTRAEIYHGATTKQIETYILYGGTSPHAKMNRLKEIDFDMNGDGDTTDSGDYGMTMGYDANGNMTSKDVTYLHEGGTNVSWDYYYDADDRLVKVEKDEATVAEYGYDAFGRRVLKKAGGVDKAFFYDREDILEVRTGATISDKFVNGPGIDDYIGMVRPAGQSEAGTYFYHTDGLGSSTELTTQAGSTIKSQYAYAPFGEASVMQGTTLAAINTYQYTGREMDATINLMYYRSRHYDPGQRRFVQEDEWMGDTSNQTTFTNKYIYCYSNPINFIDPSGHQADPVSAGVMILVLSIIVIAFAILFAYLMNPSGFVNSFKNNARTVRNKILGPPKPKFPNTPLVRSLQCNDGQIISDVPQCSTGFGTNGWDCYCEDGIRNMTQPHYPLPE